MDVDLGAFIARGKTSAAPHWLLWGLAVLSTCTGCLLAIGCASMLFSMLSAEVQGGRIGVGVGAMLCMFGGLMIHSARSKSITHRVDFFENGVKVCGGPNHGSWLFQDLEQFAVTIILAGPWLSLKAADFCLMSLCHIVVIWNVDGVVVSSHDFLWGGGGVRLSADGQMVVNAGGMKVAKLEAIAEAANSALGTQVSTIVQA